MTIFETCQYTQSFPSTKLQNFDFLTCCIVLLWNQLLRQFLSQMRKTVGNKRISTISTLRIHCWMGKAHCTLRMHEKSSFDASVDYDIKEALYSSFWHTLLTHSLYSLVPLELTLMIPRWRAPEPWQSQLCLRLSKKRSAKERGKNQVSERIRIPKLCITLSAEWESPFANEFLLKLPDAYTLLWNGLHSFLHSKYLPDSMEYVMCIQCFPFERNEGSLHDEHWFMLDAFVESFSISLVKYSRRFTLFAQRNHILFLFA
jgi:hypothetical protein